MSRANCMNIPNSKNGIKQFMAKNRSWQPTQIGKKLLKRKLDGLDFTVMSYNILAQKLLQSHMYLYNKCDQKYLNWSYRVQNLLQEIIYHNADIVCLQEVQEDHFTEKIMPHLYNHGYFGLFKKKTCRESCDGCAILFKKDSFHLETHEAVEFQNPQIRILDRSQIGLVAVLKPRHSHFKNAKIVVATTHLLFNPRRGDIKFTQIRMFLARIELLARRLIFNYEMVYHPVILCGDMNCHPFSPLYYFITHGKFTFDQILSGNVSGQLNGYNKGQYLCDSELSLTALGISDTSQYITSATHSSASSSSSSMVMSQESVSNAAGKKSKLFSHPLHLFSAYRHLAFNKDQEVTNLSKDECYTSDYIFYSMGYVPKFTLRKGHIPENGELKNIANYSLPLLSMIENLPPLPNAFLSSDHVCLVSRFLLQPKMTF